jgi:hypothetical protein
MRVDFGYAASKSGDVDPSDRIRGGRFMRTASADRSSISDRCLRSFCARSTYKEWFKAVAEAMRSAALKPW